MKKNYFFILCVFSLLFTACNSDDDITPDTPHLRLKQMTYQNTGGEYQKAMFYYHNNALDSVNVYVKTGDDWVMSIQHRVTYESENVFTEHMYQMQNNQWELNSEREVTISNQQITKESTYEVKSQERTTYEYQYNNGNISLLTIEETHPNYSSNYKAEFTYEHQLLVKSNSYYLSGDGSWVNYSESNHNYAGNYLSQITLSMISQADDNTSQLIKVDYLYSNNNVLSTTQWYEKNPVDNSWTLEITENYNNYGLPQLLDYRNQDTVITYEYEDGDGNENYFNTNINKYWYALPMGS